MRRRGMLALAGMVAAVLAIVAVLAWSQREEIPTDARVAASEGHANGEGLHEGRLEAQPHRVPTRVGVDARLLAEAGPDRIVGRVLDEAGRPIPRAHLAAYRTDPHLIRGVYSPVSIASTDEEGAFVLKGCAAGEHWIDVTGVEGRRAVSTHAPAGGGPIPITMEASASARVTVLDESGSPVARASVVAEARRRDPSSGYDIPVRAQAVAGDDGVALLEGIDDVLGDSTRLLAIPPVARQQELRSGHVSGWDRRDVTIRLPRQHVIEGLVRDPKGEPLPRARVRVVARTVEGRDAVRSWEDADRQGRFRVEGLAEDQEVRLSASPASARPPLGNDLWSREVVARAGARDVVLFCDPGGTLDLRIEGWPAWTTETALLTGETEPRPLAGAERVDVNGHVRFEALDRAGAYTLFLPAPTWSDVCVYVTGLRPGPATQTVALRATRVLRGRVVSPEPLTELHVSAGAPGLSIQARLLDAGRFEICGVPADLTVRVHGLGVAGPTVPDPYFSAAVDAPPGGTDLLLELEPRSAEVPRPDSPRNPR